MCSIGSGLPEPMGCFASNRMKKALFTFLVLFVATCRISSIPARPVPIIVCQEDGTYLRVCLQGDERFHFTTTTDNMPIVQGLNGNYYYAIKQGENLECSNLLAHNQENRSVDERNYIKENIDVLVNFIESQCRYNSPRKDNFAKARRSSITRSVGQRTTYQGKKKGLVILVNFSNLTMVTENAHDEFYQQFNQVGYNHNNHIGSVHDYFYDQSYGIFDLSFDVVGPVTVSRQYSYYGANSPKKSNTDLHVGQMISEACKLADNEVNYADYDWDGDGEVDQVYVIYAGYGEASGAPANTIWPHEYSLTGCAYSGDGDGPLTLDGVKIDTYACSCELAGYSGKIMMGIGTACHEFSHCLGLPDFYDVKYNGGFGMESWDIMDSGGYNGPDRNGEVPCGYTAYERWFAGWLTFTELNEMERIKDMPDLGTTPMSYIIYNNSNHDEYFTLENRQNTRWFEYVNTSRNCHGLLITHVDYSARAWLTNSVNTNSEHQRMSIVPADNDYGFYYNDGANERYVPSNEELEGDLFPGNCGITEFTNISHINVGGRLFNQNDDGTFYLNKPITNIKEAADGLISFDFMGGIYVPKPHSLSAEVEETNAFVVHWDIDGEVDSFEIEATEIRKNTPLGSLMISENFANFLTEPGSDDGKMDLSTYLNSYTQINGWSGKRIYTSADGAKIGNSTDSGHLMTPFKDSNSNSITVKLAVKSLDNTTTPIKLSLISERNDTVSSYAIASLNEKQSYVFTFTDIAKGYYAVNIKGDAPFYISSFSMFDGDFSENDLSITSMIGLVTPVEKYIVSGITKKTYKFANLKANEFQYRIRAEKDEAFSQWSEYDTIKLDDLNGITNRMYNGNSKVKIYNLNGMKIENVNKGGLYIFDYGTHKKKIVIYD